MWLGRDGSELEIAATVTRGAVRCSAWLGVSVIWITRWKVSEDCRDGDCGNADESGTPRRDGREENDRRLWTQPENLDNGKDESDEWKQEHKMRATGEKPRKS